MKRTNPDTTQANVFSRRQAVTGLAVAFGALAAGSNVLGQSQPSAATEKPGTAANQKRTSLHQEINFKASPARIYEVLLDSKQFTTFTGNPAEIDPKEGGAFSLFGGLIVGRNVESVPDQRIVQAWRPTHWDAGIYSIVEFQLKAHDSETELTLDHKGFPEGDFDHLDSGWKLHYWERLEKFLA